MSRSQPISFFSATTTYPFTLTTYTTSLPSTSFTKPTIVPSLFSFGPGLGCSSANAAPSAVPLDIPRGTQGACVISNAQEVNDHAFWDLYACCKGGGMTAFGAPNVCTAQCQAEGQTILELGDCLSKRVAKVVCKAALNERPANGTQSASSSASGSVSRTASGSQATTSSPATSTGGAPAGGVVHGGGAKVVGFVFGLLAFGSAAGMML